MANRPNLIGQTFGRLMVIAEGPKRGARRSWACRCVCGNEAAATTSDLRYGDVASCGCLLKGATAANRKHGHSHRSGTSLTYNSWRAMIDRCSNSSHAGFENYGGRGITVCGRWQTFENFLADMGERPSSKHSIDRIDPDGNYEPDNCRWATAKEQRRNRRRAA